MTSRGPKQRLGHQSHAEQRLRQASGICGTATTSNNSLSGAFCDMAAMPAQGGAHQLWHPDRSKTGVFPDLFRNIKKPFKLSEPHDKKKNNPTLIILSGTTVCLHAVYEKKAWLIQCLGRQTLDLSRHAWMQCK